MPSELAQDQLDKLLSLMSFGGSASNGQLKQRYQYTLTGPKRVELVNGGYISSTRANGRVSYQHELTPKGRDLCAETLRSGPNSSASLGHRINQGMLEQLSKLLEANDIDLFEQDSAESEPKEATKEGLHSAYLELASRPGAWVSLSKLRSKLEGIDREPLDDLIRELHVAGSVTLIPEENRRSITPDDRAAAIRIGAEDRHLISIGRPL